MNLKDKILGVAKELFIKNGYNATTTGEIVKLSESSKGNLYYHFKTKENLFLEILNIEESKWQEQWKKEQIKCKTNREKFYLYNELSLTTEYYYPLQNAIIEFCTEYYKTNSINEKMNKLENKYIDAYHVIFKEGNLNGEWCINDVNAVSKIAAKAVEGLVTFTHEQNINERIKLMNKFSQIFLNGLSK